MDKLELKALGKINLGLDVLGRQENGYHQVRMVMQSVFLYDQVTLQKQKDPGIELESNLYYLPVGETNLAFQAAKLLLDEFEIQEGVQIQLGKHIPVAAGLAGGSTDAAAVLFGMNQLFDLGLSREELLRRGAVLGADVPFCILRGTVLAEGIGDQLTQLPALPRMQVLLVKPPFSVSTKLVYQKLDEQKTWEHPDIDGILAGLQRQDIQKIADSMGNVLEGVTVKEYPVIHQIEDVMIENGALNALMSGSGPTVFGLYQDKDEARDAAVKIREMRLAKQVYVVNTYGARRQS